MHVTHNKTRTKIDVFFLDTKLILFNRTARALNILPEYLWLEEQKEGEFEAINLLDYMEEPIEEVIRLTENKFDPEMVIELWASRKDPTILDYLLVTFEERYKEKFKDVLFNVRKTMYLEEFKIKEKEKLSAFKREQDVIFKTNKNFDRIEEYPSIETDKKTNLLIIMFKCSIFTLGGMFDRLHVSPRIPLITFDGYYKVLKHFAPPFNWKSSNDIIVGKLEETRGEYVDVVIRKCDQGKYSIELNTSNHYDAEKIMMDTITSLGGTFEEKISSNIGSTFSVDINIDNHIFGDLIFTSSGIIPQCIAVNDNIINVGAFGSREVAFTTPYDDKVKIRASMSRHLSGINDALPPNTRYTTIKIVNANDNQSITTFKTFFCKLMTVYIFKQQSIKDAYSVFGLGEEKEPEAVKTNINKHYLKDAVPAIFQSKNEEIYSRKCQVGKQPRIISQEEAEDQKDLQVMRFPKESDSHISTPQFYICEKKGYLFPGLIKFGNEIGYAPCCFALDQREKSKYKEYFEGIAPSKPKAQQTYMTRTDKIITAKNYGYFPSGDIINNIGVLFSKVCPPEMVVLRKGVDQSPNSFLNCVLLAMNSSAVVGKSGEDLQKSLIEERKRLLERVNAEVVMQENYGESLDNIKKYINDVESYLDPERTIRLLEIAFGCNILLFAKTSQYPLGELIVPRHIKGYCTFKRDDSKPSIFIFNHMGAETDMLKYPHCELIVHVPADKIKELKNNAHSSVWTPDDPGYMYCWEIYMRLTSHYFAQFKVLPISNLCKLRLDIKSQAIDEYGKVRLIKVKHDGREMVVETSPLPPFDVKLMSMNTSPTLSSRAFIVDFMRTHQLENPIEYSLTENGERYPQYFEGRYKGRFSIKLYIDSNQRMYPADNQSVRENYINSSKIARYLSNWILYMFSRYVFENNITTLDKPVIRGFFEDKVEVNAKHEYNVKNISDEFNMESSTSLFTPDGRLICNSIEIAKRLLFQMRILIERDRKGVLEYHAKQVMENFYQSESDFSSFPNETIVQWTPASGVKLSYLLESTSREYQLYKYPPKTNSPFFFKHPKITQDQVILLQNTPTIDQALAKSVIWYDLGYNQDHPMLREEIPYYMYVLAENGGSNVYQVGSDTPTSAIIATSKTSFCAVMEL